MSCSSFVVLLLSFVTFPPVACVTFPPTKGRHFGKKVGVKSLHCFVLVRRTDRRVRLVWLALLRRRRRPREGGTNRARGRFVPSVVQLFLSRS